MDNRETILLSKLELNGEVVEHSGAVIYIQPEIIDLGIGDFIEHLEWGIEAVNPGKNIEVNQEIIKIEAFGIDGNEYVGNGYIDELEYSKGEGLIYLGIQGIGELMKAEIA